MTILLFQNRYFFDYPSLLDDKVFQVYSYSWESVVAEKFEAIVKLSDLNSRMKDFYDLYFIMQNQDFDGPSLQNAINKTFVNRGTDIKNHGHIFSAEFKKSEDKNKQWQAFLKKSKLDLNISFDKIIEFIQNFIAPVVSSGLNNKILKKKWEEKSQEWL